MVDTDKQKSFLRRVADWVFSPARAVKEACSCESPLASMQTYVSSPEFVEDLQGRWFTGYYPLFHLEHELIAEQRIEVLLKEISSGVFEDSRPAIKKESLERAVVIGADAVVPYDLHPLVPYATVSFYKKR